MSVQEIETAITQLRSDEFWKLSDWILEQRNRDWDKQIERDLDAGHFDSLIVELTGEYKQGLTKPL